MFMLVNLYKQDSNFAAGAQRDGPRERSKYPIVGGRSPHSSGDAHPHLAASEGEEPGFASAAIEAR